MSAMLLRSSSLVSGSKIAEDVPAHDEMYAPKSVLSSNNV